MKLNKPGSIFLSFMCGAAVLALFASNGIFPERHPIYKDQYIVERHMLREGDWKVLAHRNDFVLCLVWAFATSGTSTILPSNFTTTNEIDAIGAGAAGFSGANFPSGCCGGSISLGGNGGGGGAYAQILNYSGHTAGQAVSIQVGTSDSWFASSATLLAKAASGQTGGQASACVGTTKISGSDGTAGIECGTAFGGSGGKAAGPSTFGSNQGAGAQSAHRGNGNLYGGGGGGGDGTVCCAGEVPGAGAQGLIAIGYTLALPASQFITFCLS